MVGGRDRPLSHRDVLIPLVNFLAQIMADDTSQLPKVTPAAVDPPSLYQHRDVEPRPNHASIGDFLAMLPYQHKLQPLYSEGFVRRQHSDGRYVQYELLGMDSSGNFIPITPETSDEIVGSFDWYDHKLVSLLLMATMEADGAEFEVSGSWLLDILSDSRKMTTGNERGYLSKKEKLDELVKRIKRLRTVSIQCQWHVGRGKSRRHQNLLNSEGIAMADLALFLIPLIWFEGTGKSQDFKVRIIPGKWYELYCQDESLQQFSWIPKELFGINTYTHWRRYAIGNYIVTRYRTNRQNLKKIALDNGQVIEVLRRSLDNLLKEVLTPTEIEYALNDRRKAHKLKKGILEDFDYFREQGWYVTTDYSKGNFETFLNSNFEAAPRPPASTFITEGVEVKETARAGRSRQQSASLSAGKTSNRNPKQTPEEKTKPTTLTRASPRTSSTGSKSKTTGTISSTEENGAYSPSEELTGDRVKQIRTQRRLSRRQLASDLGIHPDYISKMERGVRRITPEMEQQLREALQIFD